jgi:hypothetical protein
MARFVTGAGTASRGEVREVYGETVIWEKPPDA